MTEELQLPPETLDSLRKANAQLNVVDSFIRKAKMAKIDMSEQEKRLSEQKQKINNLRQGFFPNETL